MKLLRHELFFNGKFVCVVVAFFSQDPVTGEDISVYPALRRFFKMMGSFGVMLFMVRLCFLRL